MLRADRQAATLRRARGALRAIAFAALLMACGQYGAAPVATPPTVCGDSQATGLELCDGDDVGDYDCAWAGFEGGTVSCSETCELVTTRCYLHDRDSDGLHYLDELAHGTDPRDPDSDTDGLLDGAEVAGGADPLNMNSWPQGVGQWPNRIAAVITDAVEGGGSLPGQVIWNYVFKDQFDQEVQLYQFYGYVVVINVCAIWCPPCRSAASTAQGLYAEHFDGHEVGVIFIENIRDGSTPGTPPTASEIDRWLADYGLQFPVVTASYAWQPINVLPTYFVLDAKLRVHTVLEGYGGDDALRAAIASARAGSVL
jgi:thiol-disulfide isomerase/thioredoxin